MERWWLVPILVMWALPVHAAPSRAEMLVAPCFACHSNDDAIRGDIPRLDIEAERIRVKLEDFREDDARTTIMGRIARGYSDEEIALIADYLGSLREQGR
ncbi:MAG: cytochrome c [Thiohalomonadaceae bacterium]